MRSEPHKEDPNVNMMLRSGIATGEDKGKKHEENKWVREAHTKQHEFNLEHAKETFMEAKKSFVEVSTPGSNDKPEPEMDPSMLITF